MQNLLWSWLSVHRRGRPSTVATVTDPLPATFTTTASHVSTRAQSAAHAGADQPSRLLLALVPYRLPVHPWE